MSDMSTLAPLTLAQAQSLLGSLAGATQIMRDWPDPSSVSIQLRAGAPRCVVDLGRGHETVMISSEGVRR